MPDLNRQMGFSRTLPRCLRLPIPPIPHRDLGLCPPIGREVAPSPRSARPSGSPVYKSVVRGRLGSHSGGGMMQPSIGSKFHRCGRAIVRTTLPASRREVVLGKIPFVSFAHQSVPEHCLKGRPDGSAFDHRSTLLNTISNFRGAETFFFGQDGLNRFRDDPFRGAFLGRTGRYFFLQRCSGVRRRFVAGIC